MPFSKLTKKCSPESVETQFLKFNFAASLLGVVLCGVTSERSIAKARKEVVYTCEDIHVCVRACVIYISIRVKMISDHGGISPTSQT